MLKDKKPETQRLYLDIVNKRDATPEEEARMMKLNKQHCISVLDIPAEKIFKIEHVKIMLPSYSRILDSHICSACGEKFMETKGVKKGGEYLCLSCGSGDYGQLDWAGIKMGECDKTPGFE